MDVGGIPQLMPNEAHDKVQTGTKMVDVREQNERDAAHIPGTLFLPLSELQARFEELPKEPLILQCAGGARSQQAAQFLASHGYEVANLAHGIQGWARMGLPIE